MNVVWDYLWDVYAKTYETIRVTLKWAIHRITNQSEIERICCHQQRSYQQTIQFASSLRLSKQLRNVSSIVFYPKPFTIPRVLPLIIEVKHIPLSVQPNVSTCLNDLRIINLICDKVDYYKKLKYTESNKDHVHEQLTLLWNHLKPDVRRSEAFLSDDWGEIGFQGKDPTTDFRGMGLLGLYQLVYLSKNRSAIAMKMLFDSNHPLRYIPFAATGINITAFVIELLQDCKFHIYLLYNLPEIQQLSDDPNTTILEKNVVESGVNIVHGIYCDIYESFMQLWVERDPPDIMSFQAIFQEFKVLTAKKFQSI